MNLNICCLNVCGLVSKLVNPDFLQLIEKYDILIFQETKTDVYDRLLLPKGYTFKAKHRNKFDRKSGGIVIIYKNEIEKFLDFPDANSEFVQWLKINHDFF